MFNGICDVDFVTADTCFFERPIENFPCWPDKWLPSEIFLITWLFAYEHQTRILHSFTEHRLSRPLEKRARLAISRGLRDGPQARARGNWCKTPNVAIVAIFSDPRLTRSYFSSKHTKIPSGSPS